MSLLIKFISPNQHSSYHNNDNNNNNNNDYYYHHYLTIIIFVIAAIIITSGLHILQCPTLSPSQSMPPFLGLQNSQKNEKKKNYCRKRQRQTKSDRNKLTYERTDGRTDGRTIVRHRDKERGRTPPLP